MYSHWGMAKDAKRDRSAWIYQSRKGGQLMTTNIPSDRSFFDDQTEYFLPDDPRWTSLKDVRKREKDEREWQ